MSHEPKDPYSLGLRLSWLFAGLTLFGLGVGSVCIYAVMFFYLDRKADVELAQKSQLVTHLVEEAAQSGDSSGMRHKLGEFFAAHEELRVSLLDASGRPTFYDSAALAAPMPMVRSAIFPVQAGTALPGVTQARIVLDRSSDAQLLTGLAVALVVTTLLGAAVVSLAGFWSVRRSMAPLRGLAEQTRGLRADQLGQRLSLDRPVQELQPWIDQVNGMLGRLEYSYSQLEGFSADVAHELRTPLATLIGQTEVELTRTRSAEELRETMASNLEELHRLSSIVNDMLFLSRADRGAKAAPALQASLASEARQVIEYYEGTLQDRRLTACVTGDAQASFDRGLIRRAISNLLSNAIRYAEPESEIKVEIARLESAAAVLVHNRGSAIPETALPRLFDRFFRIQTSREGGSENHGLGLAIVAAIARMHGGKTRAECGGGVTTVGFDIAAKPSVTGRKP